MSFTLVAAADICALRTGRWRVPAAEVAAVKTVAGLVKAAEGHAARLAAEGDAIREQAHAEGRNAGFEEGLAEGRAEAARRLAELSGAAHDERDTLRARVGTLALEVVRRIADGLGAEAVLESLAERAVRDVLPDSPLVVRVPPEAVAAVERRLWPMNAPIEVSADGLLTGAECVVETPHGRIEAGLEVQLAALERAFAAAEASTETETGTGEFAA